MNNSRTILGQSDLTGAGPVKRGTCSALTTVHLRQRMGRAKPSAK